MELIPAALDTTRREALRGLLDDTSSHVRQALLAYFTGMGAVAVPFLREVAQGSNRVLSRHARWYLDELKFDDPAAEFRGFIRSLNYELETGALLLARTVTPQLDVGACCAELDAIAARCRQLIVEPATPREQCRIINRVLFHEWSYRGNVENYTDPMNSLLDQVLIRRKGIPISLTIVYLLVAERVGLDLKPVGLPGHFVVGCFTDGAPFFVDPFDQGLFRDTFEIFALLRANNVVPKAADLAPTPVREVLCRNCRCLAGHFTAAGDPDRARLFAGFIEEFEAAYARQAT